MIDIKTVFGKKINNISITEIELLNPYNLQRWYDHESIAAK